jgi:hypothetical protein
MRGSNSGSKFGGFEKTWVKDSKQSKDIVAQRVGRQ